MRSLLNFFLKYNNILLFLLLEGVAFTLLFSRPGYQNIRAANIAGSVNGAMNEKLDRATSYFSLRKLNEDLVNENYILRKTLRENRQKANSVYRVVNDSLYNQHYVVISARVVNQTINRQKNFITLDRGTADGIETGMAVAGPNGIAGFVVGVSRNFSIAMSVLNLDFRLSARLRSNNYFGSLGWSGTSNKEAILSEIPHHVLISPGDTVETSGYSAIFPEGLIVGTVKGIDKTSGNFLNINVTLATDFASLNNVYIIGDLLKGEQKELEESIIDSMGEKK
jgi:rod shape-determining protein MreC